MTSPFTGKLDRMIFKKIVFRFFKFHAEDSIEYRVAWWVVVMGGPS